MAYAGACIGGARTAPDPDLLSNHDLSSVEVGAARGLGLTGSISVKGTLIDKNAFQKKKKTGIRNQDLEWGYPGSLISPAGPLFRSVVLSKLEPRQLRRQVGLMRGCGIPALLASAMRPNRAPGRGSAAAT